MYIPVTSVLIILCGIAIRCSSYPVTVPIYNNYHYNQQNQNKPLNDPEAIDRKPNSYFNRLTNSHDNNNNQNQLNDDYEDESENDQQTDKPVLSEHVQGNLAGNGGYYSNFNNLYSYWFGDQRIKHRHKRRKGQPCIPVAVSNRYKRDVRNNAPDGKTLSLILGDYNVHGGGGYYGPTGPQYDNTNPQNDKPFYGGGNNNYNQLLYNPYGGYPCVPGISFISRSYGQI